MSTGMGIEGTGPGGFAPTTASPAPDAKRDADRVVGPGEQQPTAKPVGAAEARMRALLDKLSDGGVNPNARLQIDRDQETGTFVYKSVDARTGEVINQWPRESILEALGPGPSVSGVVIDRNV